MGTVIGSNITHHPVSAGNLRRTGLAPHRSGSACLSVEQFLPPERHGTGGLDADADLLAVYRNYGDHNLVPDHDPFPDFPVQNHHVNSSLNSRWLLGIISGRV